MSMLRVAIIGGTVNGDIVAHERLRLGLTPRSTETSGLDD